MYCTVDDWSVKMSVQYICARECGGRPLTTHILLQLCMYMLRYCFREEGLATIYNSSYTKKIQSILYAYSYVATVQLNLNLINMRVTCTWHNTFFISLTYIHECACKIDDAEAFVQSTHVCTIRMYDNLHEHVCMSVTYTPNLVHIHIDVYINCKLRMTV